MANLQISTKRLQIDKANLQIVIAIAIASFIIIFSLFGCKALLSQRAYQSKVIAKKEVAKKQLIQNLSVVNSLVSSYKQFVAQPENAIGGTSTGAGDKDGDNAKIVLDALPSKYDFPALATSLEKVITDKNLKIDNIQGTDDELAQQTNAGSDTPQAIEMPFEINVEGNYQNTQDLIGVFEKSIRPFSVTSLSLTGSKDGVITSDVKASTYYQPEKTLNINSVVVK